MRFVGYMLVNKISYIFWNVDVTKINYFTIKTDTL